ncbi:MAG: Spy/CpxP family protein refolding chaperone [Deltaproteobacteria bacterium]|nr:Spy/CpxP family protein refolding chaperone [Deltaproteobacteria bacterium]
MRKMTFTIAAILFTFFLFSSAFAADWGRGHGGGPPGKEGDITTIPDLELTDEQILQIRNLREAHLRDIRPLQDKVNSKRKELKALWLKTTLDQDKITALQTELGKMRDMMQDKMIDYRQAIFRIMTPEQQNKLETIGRQRGFSPGPRWGKKRRDNQGTANQGN